MLGGDAVLKAIGGQRIQARRHAAARLDAVGSAGHAAGLTEGR